MAMAAAPPPPSISIPADDSATSTLQRAEHDQRHFITTSDFDKYVKLHPQLKLRPPSGATTTTTTTATPVNADEKKGYRAPQHPASHVFQTIPPRAPSRSSRSTILSYTLHLATSTRLSTYLAPNGARDLLHQAESLSTYKHKCAEASDDDVGAVVDLDPDFVESELKAQGMWKLGASLLRAAAAAQKQQQGIDGAVESSGLPPMVERRVALAALTENLLVTPEPDLVEVGHQPSDGGDHLVDALTNAENLTDQKSSGELDAICALKPLTSPDTTTLYNTSSTFNAGSSSSASASAASATGSSSLSPTAIFSSSARGSGSNPSSIAQSLINMKFGGVEEEAMTTLATNETGTTAMSLDDDKDKKPSNAAGPPSREAETVFASSHLDPASTSTTTTTTQSMTAPHMDYRIVRGQAMRSRARAIYATSILSPSAPSSTSTATARWCRRHRVLRCCVCRAIVDADSKIDRRTLNIPGQGLRDAVSPTTNATLPKRVLAQGGPGRTGRNKKTLAELVPDFLDLSAQLMKDQRERSTSSNDATTGVESTNAATEWTVTATASWYALLHAFLIQATLEGYLVEGWTGTGGIETLLGVGCGVWEGRGWDTRRDGVAVEREAEGGEKDKPEEVDEGNRSEQSDDSSSSSSSGDDDDDEDEEAEAAFERERAKDKLVAAAQALFGSRNVAQADFERSMRDRTHEFLNVPEHTSLRAHLTALNHRYPLSSFENDMVDFLECTTRQLGKPALARYDISTPTNSAATSSGTNTSFSTESTSAAHSVTGTAPAPAPAPVSAPAPVTTLESSNTTSPPSSNSNSNSSAGGEPDPYALARYFTRTRTVKEEELEGELVEDDDSKDARDKTQARAAAHSNSMTASAPAPAAAVDKGKRRRLS